MKSMNHILTGVIIIFCFLCIPDNVKAQDAAYTMGGASNQLKITVNKGGTWIIYRESTPGSNVWERQFYFDDREIFSLKIGTTVYNSNASSITKTDISNVTTGIEQYITKKFSGEHDNKPFNVTLTFNYNTSNPNYLTITSTIDAASIPTGQSISLAYGFDAFVNGCDAGAAIIVPDLGYNNKLSQVETLLTQEEIRGLRMVGGINTHNSGSLIAFFPMGKPFDRAYSAYWSSSFPTDVINQSVNKFRFGLYEVPNCSSSTWWDNGVGVAYDNIQSGEVTDIRTGLSFTQDLDGELDYTWNGSKNYVANLGDNINLNLSYTSYNSSAMNNVGFRVNLPGLKLLSGATQSGFSSGTFSHTAGNEYYQVTNATINALSSATMTVPIEINQAGQWSIDGDAISNMSRTLPLGSPAILTVKSTVGLSSTDPISICKGTSHTFTVKLPDGVTAAQDFVVNLTYTGATSSFATLPTTVNIPANQNSVTFTVTSLSNATDNAMLNISLESTNKEFVTIGAANTTTVTVLPSIVAGNITGNLFVCAGMIPLPLQGEASTGGSGNLTYQWQSKPESTGSWSDIPGATQQNYTPTSALTGNTLFRRMTTDDHCDEFKYYSNEILIKVVATPTTLYWNPNALDNNWNNPDNWLTALNGSSVGMVPLACTDVFISNVNIYSKYPALDNRTQTDVYGEPVCKNITFAYGAELAYQHKLQYEKAFVRYNWGYYNTPTTGQPANSWDGSQKLDRDQWHILAAPLKSMATGDFSLAGYPFTWQSQFNTSSDGSVVVGNFSVPFATNDMPLTRNNNAIAVKITSYQNLSGYRQNNLEGLKGILEFPYFENPVALPHYTAHHYDAIGKKSYFYYFDTKTLKLINSPLGSMKRGDEAYRFIYETSSNEPPASGTYDMQVEVSGSDNEVMVGNPFLANIDALAFYTANSSKINLSEGYKLLSSDDMTWEQMQFSTGNIIPAWQAFIVTLQPGATSLSFPLEASHTRMASVAGETRATDATVLTGNTLYMQLLKGGTKSGDQSELRYNNAIDGNGIRKMILSEGHATPEVFFIDPDKSTAQLVQPFVQGQREIGIGVKSSDTQTRLSLEFLNVPAFNAATGASVVLVDKHLNARQDLSRNPVYPFTQQASGLDNEYVDKNRFVLQLGNGNETGTQEDVEGIQIAYSGGILKVTADENISEVAVYDLHGRLVFIVRSVNKTHFSQSVVLQSNPYLAQVKTVSGKVKVKKIIGS